MTYQPTNNRRKSDIKLNNDINDTPHKAILYARVSTPDQRTDRQVRDMLEWCKQHNITETETICETITGTIEWRHRKVASHIFHIKTGEILLSSEPSRISRTLVDLLDLCDVCLKRGAGVVFLSPSLTISGDPMGRAILSLIGVVGDLERSLLRERQASSIREIRRQLDLKGFYICKSGKKITRMGRPVSDIYHSKLDKDKDKLKLYLAKGMSITECAKLLSVSRKTIYDYMRSRGIQR